MGSLPGPLVSLQSPVVRHSLYADLLVPLWHPDLLVLSAHLLADPYLTGFTFTCTGPKLFFGPLYPKLLLVAKVFSIRVPSACSLVVALRVYLTFLLARGYLVLLGSSQRISISCWSPL